MTLTEMSYYGRKMAPLAAIALLVLLIFYFAVQLFLMYLKGQNKPAGTAQTQSQVAIKPVFDKIKKPVFIDAEPSSIVSNYVLDTLDGTPITATESSQIYFNPNKEPSFGFLQKIYFMAQKVGFDTELVKHKLTDERTASFFDGLRALTVNISNFNFNYQYTLTSDNIKLVTGAGLTQTAVENAASDFLRNMDRYPEELARGERNVNYFNLNIETKALTPVNTIEEANMAEIGFFRPQLNGLDMVAPKHFNSPHFVVVAFTETSLQVVRAQVMLFEKSDEQVGIYPLKTGAKALEDLMSGKGYIVSRNPNDPADTVNIKSMYLAYVDNETYHEYTQPIFVFLGENNFVAYVPAVTDEYFAD